MATFEYWVDTTLGSDSNAGTQAAPWKTLLHASRDGLPQQMTSGDTVTLNIVPSGVYDDANDYIRPEPADWAGGKLIVQGENGQQWEQSAAQLIYGISTCDLELEIKNAKSTCNLIQLWAGLTTDTGTGIRLTIYGDCEFIHSRTNAEDGINFDSDASGSSLTVLPGAKFTGWASPFYAPDVTSAIINGAICNAGQCDGDTGYLYADVCQVLDCSFTWPRAVANKLQLRSQGTVLDCKGNTFSIESTSTDSCIEILAPASGVSSTVEVNVSDNEATGNLTGAVMMLGTIASSGTARATQDATVDQFASVEFHDNTIINTNNGGRALNVYLGTTGANITKNFFRCGTLGDTTNVHNVYLYGADVRFEDNFCQSQVLAFGPGQIIRNNIIVADRCILLGGDQGGSLAIGGGNNYFITENVLIAYEDDCIGDYAWNGAYAASGANIGVLRCVADSNIYSVLSNGNGIARLTDSDLVATTLAELQNVWQEGALTGSGSVWGEDTNKANDGQSKLMDKKRFPEAAASATLNRKQLEAMKARAKNDQLISVGSFGTGGSSLQAVDTLGRRASV